jgi:hypothetical protein
MAVAFPIGVEVFGNCSSCVATSTYGTTNPAAGTTEQWVMGTGSTSFPVANFNASTTFTNPSATPPGNYFYIRDPADTTNEIVLVYSGGSSSTTWYVQRGMNGATVAHSALATWVQVISPYTLQNFKQAPGATTTPVTVGNTATETVVATYTPVSTDIAAATSYEAVAYGIYATNNATARAQMTWTLRWGGVTGTILCQVTTNSNAASLSTTTSVAGASFDVNGTVTLLSTTTATANLNLFYTNSSNSLVVAQSTATATNATAGAASSATAVTISGSGPLVLTFKWTNNAASTSMTATAPLIYRAA